MWHLCGTCGDHLWSRVWQILKGVLQEAKQNNDDAANEAKDNVKYLTTLDKYIDVLYMGTTAEVHTSPLCSRVQQSGTMARWHNGTMAR